MTREKRFLPLKGERGGRCCQADLCLGGDGARRESRVFAEPRGRAGRAAALLGPGGRGDRRSSEEPAGAPSITLVLFVNAFSSTQML